jgi:hypothetical protein
MRNKVFVFSSCIVLAFFALFALPARAQSQAEAAEAANALFVDAVLKYRQAEALGGSEADAVYREVRRLLDMLLLEHPSSRPVQALRELASPGGIDLGKLPEMDTANSPESWNDAKRGIARDLLTAYQADLERIAQVADGADYALLSAAAYAESPTDESLRLAAERGWSFVWRYEKRDDTNPLVGSAVALLFRSSSGSHVLAYRGSKRRGDWVTNTLGTISSDDLHSAQVEAAREVAIEVAGLHPDVIFVGHSLGGRLAQVARLTTNKPAVAFNSAPLGTNDHLRALKDRRDADALLLRFRAPEDTLTSVFAPGDIEVSNFVRVEGGVITDAVNFDFTHAMKAMAQAMQAVRIARDEGWIDAFVKELRSITEPEGNTGSEAEEAPEKEDWASKRIGETADQFNVFEHILYGRCGDDCTLEGTTGEFRINLTHSGKLPTATITSTCEMLFQQGSPTCEPGLIDVRSLSGGSIVYDVRREECLHRGCRAAFVAVSETEQHLASGGDGFYSGQAGYFFDYIVTEGDALARTETPNSQSQGDLGHASRGLLGIYGEGDAETSCPIGPVVLSSNRVDFYESSCEFERPIPEGATRFRTEATCTGEGETWKRDFFFSASDDGFRLSVRDLSTDDIRIFERCTADDVGPEQVDKGLDETANADRSVLNALQLSAIDIFALQLSSGRPEEAIRSELLSRMLNSYGVDEFARRRNIQSVIDLIQNRRSFAQGVTVSLDSRVLEARYDFDRQYFDLCLLNAINTNERTPYGELLVSFFVEYPEAGRCTLGSTGRSLYLENRNQVVWGARLVLPFPVERAEQLHQQLVDGDVYLNSSCASFTYEESPLWSSSLRCRIDTFSLISQGTVIADYSRSGGLVVRR